MSNALPSPDTSITFLDAPEPHAPTNQELELARERALEAAHAVTTTLANGDTYCAAKGKRVHVMRFNDAGRQVHEPFAEHLATRPDGSQYSLRLPVVA